MQRKCASIFMPALLLLICSYAAVGQTSLPSGWFDGDVGTVGLAGSATYSGGVFTVKGSGVGVYPGTADSFHSVYQPLSGDGTIVARVLSSTGGKAGVMIRETLAPGAMDAFTVKESGDICFYYRGSTDGSVGYKSYFSANLPYWVKVVRSGSTFSGYMSLDGVNWTGLGSTQITIGQNSYIGLAVTSQSNSTLATATFDNVSASTSTVPAPVITGLSATTGSVGSTVVISGSGFGASQSNSMALLNDVPLTISSWSDSSVTGTIPSGATSGPIVVQVAPTMNSSNPVAFTVTTQPLPTTWLDQDVGSVTLAGSATYSGGVFTVKGAGGGTYSTTADGFHFVYQPLSGDGTIVARATSLQGGSGPQAGVMIRETLDPGATNLMMGPLGSYYVTFRTTTGANSGYQSGGTVTYPTWVKVTRSGSTFTSYTSTDGVNWVQFGSARTISMAQNVYIGLAVSGRSTTALATATFDNVSVSTSIVPAPVITGLSATTGSVGSTVAISGSGFGASQSSSVAVLNDVPLTISSWSDSSVTATIPSGATSGPIVVQVAPTMNSSNPAGFTVTTQPLPATWLDQDVSSVTLAGSATYSGGVFTVKGSGGGTYSTTVDGFHFVYQPLSGDGTIVARVMSLQGTNPSNIQAGVMIRESLDPSATNVFMQDWGGTWYLTYRATTGATSSYVSGPRFVLPGWMKLTRSGNTFTSYSSSDGVNWVQVGSAQSITMAQNVYIGLAVSSRTNSYYGTATFDNVSVSTSTVSAPVITNVSPEAAVIGGSVVITGTGFGALQGSSVVLLNAVPMTVNSWSDTSINVTIPPGATSGPMVVSVAPTMNNSNPFRFVVANQTFGSWVDGDIGTVGLAGSASYSNGIFTVNGSGAGMSGTADSTNFLFQPLYGDGAIVARVLSSSGGQAGVMIRETLTTNSTDSFVDKQSSSLYLFGRASIGGTTTQQGFVTAPLPYWVKVTRAGNTFTGYTSPDGINWTSLSSLQVTMGPNAYLGLVVSSQNNSTLATATFDSVSLSQASVSTPVITNLSATTGSVGSQLVVMGSGFGSSQEGSFVTLNGLILPVSSWSSNSISVSIPAGATSGPVVVSVAPGMNSSNPITFTVTSQPLPSGWLDRDIGAVGGSATYVNGTFSISGAGGQIGSTSDAFHFVYQPLSGDGTIIARVISVQGGSDPQAGLMIRETLDPGSREAFAWYHLNTVYSFLYGRVSPGASVTSQSGPYTTKPYWLKLTRNGNTFTGYISADGVYWNQIATQTISMTQNVYIGLALSNQGATATFDNVSISSTASPAPVISSISATTAAIGDQVQITGSGFGPSQGSSMVLLSDAPMTVNSWSDTSISITISSGAISGYLAVAKAPSMNSSNAISFTVTSQPLPSGWLDRDIGATGGSAGYSAGTFTVMGSGGYISGTSDAFHFVYQSLSGDGTIVARVVNLQGSSYYQSGVIIRETLDLNSTEALVFFQPNQAFFYTRVTTGASVTAQAAIFVAPQYPYWVKVARSGNTLTGYISLDGVYWTQAGTQTISMAQNVYVGLAESYSGSTATFDNVSVTGGAPYVTPTVTSVSPTVAGPGYSITVNGSNFGTSQGTSNIYFNGVPAASITSWSDSQIVATVPDTATTGPVTVVENGVGSNRTVSLTVYKPVITSVTPPFAGPGGKVVISGSGLSGPSGQVLFNGIASNAGPWSDSSVTAVVPAGATTGSVVASIGGISSNSLPFTVIDTVSITGITPSSTSVGSLVTISGTGFGPSQSNSVVTFDGVPVTTVSSWSDNTIEAVVPDGASSGQVTVQVAGVTAYGPNFTVASYVTLTDSLGNLSYYAAEIQGGKWYVNVAQGGGCSSCTIPDDIQRAYDLRGNLLSALDGLGRTTSYTYDGADNVSSVTQPAVDAGTPQTTYTYNSFGEVLTMTDPLSHVTTNTYDSKGNLLTVTTPKPDANTTPSVTTFGYDPKGELTTITDPLNHVTTIVYNTVGLIQSITDANNKTTSYEYDAQGNRTAVVDALQKRTTFAYDTGNRLTTITYPDTTTVTFGYDYRGRRTSVTDQNGKVTTYAYDDADRLTAVTDANNKTTQYAYDTENNLTSITDALGRITSFTYDPKRRVTEADFPSSYSELYGYDAVGNLTSKTDRKSQTITYVYDALNRLTHKGYPDSTGVDYVYDLVGKIQQVNDPTGTYSFAYDNMGRLIGTTTQYSFLPGSNFTNAYTYDAASNRKTFTAPDGGTNNYTYDVLNRMTDLTNSWAGHFGFSYDELSRRTQLAKPNGISTNYAYDSVSRLLSVLHQAGTTTVDGASYTNDNAGNRTSKQNLLTGITDNYSYDPIYQLTQVLQGSSTTEAYTYDDVGNRLSDVSSSGWQYNSSNQLTSTPSVTNTFDQNGNTLTKAEASGTTQYNWDFENRLTSVILPAGGGTVTFKYDPFGRRIQKVTASGTTNYVYDGANFIAEYDDAGALLAKYAQGAGIDEPLAISRSGQTGYYDADGLGSITSVIDNTLTPLATYTYDAFGKKVTTGGSLINPFQYTGREWDQETGLYYYCARYYEPSLGRFLSEDPLQFQAGLDFYSYAAGNPVRNIDPTGRETEIIIWEPLGRGESAFGHASVVINGTSYSWAPVQGQSIPRRLCCAKGKMDIRPAAEYIANNTRNRGGMGYKIKLTSQQEAQFQAYLTNYSGAYWIGGNCQDPIVHGLHAIGVFPWLFTQSLTPHELDRELHDSNLIQSSHYHPIDGIPVPQ